jgi:homoserine kinase type II
MSVYTSVSHAQLSAWLKAYELGELEKLEGIPKGIENTNYFVTTSTGRYVLTLFEKLRPEELPFYLGLMTHLADHGIPAPKPIANHTGEVLAQLCGRPAIIVPRLAGTDVETPAASHCEAVGVMLARMHVAGAGYANTMPNPRGLHWWRGAALEITPHLASADATMLAEELRFQSLYRLEDLPRGAIHADLFRDNVLFDDGRIGGIIDFYFACTDALLFDLAIAVNDWCVLPDLTLDPLRTSVLVGAYRRYRPTTALERGAWPTMLRAAALRFWISRLFDLHCPRPGELTFAKDPEHFRRMLALRIAHHAKAYTMLA